jgi:hypothetical protein
MKKALKVGLVALGLTAAVVCAVTILGAGSLAGALLAGGAVGLTIGGTLIIACRPIIHEIHKQELEECRKKYGILAPDNKVTRQLFNAAARPQLACSANDVRLAIEAGADVNAPDPKGRNPLDIVAEKLDKYARYTTWERNKISNITETWNELVRNGASLRKYKGNSTYDRAFSQHERGRGIYEWNFAAPNP